MYKAKSKEEKETEVKLLIENADKKIDEYFYTPESIKEYLSFMSKFYNYSLNNTILINNQFKGAIAVGSYAFWKDKGFTVNKEEKGIKILVPKKGKDRFENEKGEIKTVDKATNEEKKKIEQGVFEVHKGRIYFNQGYVFDVSQTNATAQDLPKIFPNRWLEGNIPNYSAMYKGMEAIAEKIGVKIIEPKSELGASKGVSYTLTKEVALNPRNSELQNVKTLLHELTHAKLHTKDNLDKYKAYEKEFQAELTAYTICSHFGIDTSEYSLKYLSDWTKDKTLNDKKDLLKEIKDTAVEYIDIIENELSKNKELDLGKKPSTNYYVAECMEFQNLGEKYVNIPSIEKAIEIFKNIPESKHNMGNGIGISIDDGKNLDSSISEWSLFENGDIDNLEYYPKEIRENESVLNAVQVLKNELNKSEKSKDDEFMKEYLEQQRRKSLAKQNQKNPNIEI